MHSIYLTFICSLLISSISGRVTPISPGACTTNAKWYDAVNLRWHHVSFAVADVCASAYFYQEVLGFRVQQSTLIPIGPCTMKSIVMTGGGGNLMDLNQMICPEGIPSPFPIGFLHHVYDVTDVGVFVDRMTKHNLTVVIPHTTMDVNGTHLELACYLDPDNIQFCGARQWGIMTSEAF